MKRKLISVFVLLVLLCLSFTGVVYFTESPVLLFSSPKKNAGNAAIAIRDNVIPFQKFGTRLFTYPNLTGAYGKVVYLTEYKRNEKRDEFIKELDKLLDEYKQVDVLLLAHANEFYKWVREIDSVKRKNIRLVYNTGCAGSAQEAIWLDLGVKSYVAHASNQSISPVFYFYFLRRWCGQQTLERAVTEGNVNMELKLNRLGVKVDPLVLNESRAACFGECGYKIND